ncbi:MAG: hypothetical protein ABUL62_26460 [Myxococcales bacterium]
MSNKLDLSKELVGRRALVTGGTAASAQRSRSACSTPARRWW